MRFAGTHRLGALFRRSRVYWFANVLSARTAARRTPPAPQRWGAGQHALADMVETSLGLPPDALYRSSDPAQLTLESMGDGEAVDLMFGQDRAVEALRVAIGVPGGGYNVFALGPAETDKQSLIRRLLEEEAASEERPSDWCYVFNFDQPNRPRALELPAGHGPALAADMDGFVENLKTGLAAAFESEEYQTRRQIIGEEFQQDHQQALEDLRDTAEEKGFAFLHTPTGFLFVPVREGNALSPEEIQNLADEEQDRLEREIEELQEQLLHILRAVPSQQREMSERVLELNRDVARYAVDDLIQNLRSTYDGQPAVQSYLDAVEADIVENINQLLQQVVSGSGPWDAGHKQWGLERYTVNSFVCQGDTSGAPVVYEEHPTLRELVGRSEYNSRMGVLETDFTLLRPGALHQANGGYLLLDARRVLQQPFAWEGLKRTLRSAQIRIQSPYEDLGIVSTVSLEPEPIPLDVKLVLLGDRWTYYLLQAHDPEFDELFRIEADFEDEIDRTDESERRYAQLLRHVADRAELRPLEPDALARLLEHSARRAGDAHKLSMEIDSMREIAREANFWAGNNGRETVARGEIERALEARRRRAGRIRERVQENILRETLFIDTKGSKIGQINGLSVLQIGRDTFGRPSRITARVQLGTGNVVDIEREVELGGPIHSKGVLILSGFLGARFATERPLSLTATLVFEQSYGGIEGDSASSAELYALLSAIGEVPLQQSYAVTGSVNQHGEIQPIGGVNAKIEGFFDICRERGLTSEHGVLIPQANTKDLMLRPEVVEAVDAGQFHVIPVQTIDEGMEVLTGLEMGSRQDDGSYSPGSVNERVASRLEVFAKERAEFQLRSDDQNGSIT